ncbi:uncharacterized protein LOC106647093 [Copidosoma floridanum]|uniref:uncharacterized protein LOC106647093 n=1 Tax=Copidosoma floridanum TaxID=29053 RepID=UPI0006C9D2A0|nr:uncharacterized protein LOC106647093 [Copidosoma floridanum]
MDGYGGNYRGAGSHVHTTAMYLQLGDFLNLCYPPPMILLGFLGNLLSGLVFMSKQMRVRSSSYYLAALAFADIGFLSWFLINWLNFYLSLRVFDWPGFCEVAIYIRSVCVSLSAWLKVAFTVERFVAVLYPLHRPQICTARRAQHIVLTLVALALVSHSYCIVTLNPVNFDPWITMCKTKNNYLKTMYIVNIVNDLVNLVGPIVLVAVMNTCIWLKFSRSGKPFAYGHQQQNLELQSQPQQMPQGSQIYNIPKSVSSTTQIGPSLQDLESTCNEHNTTKMLLLVSTAFVILGLPRYLTNLKLFVSWYGPMQVLDFQIITMILYYTNFSINFFIYLMWGVTFRRCLWQLLCC